MKVLTTRDHAINDFLLCRSLYQSIVYELIKGIVVIEITIIVLNFE